MEKHNPLNEQEIELTAAETKTDMKNALRETICEWVNAQPVDQGLDTVEVSEALIECAFAFRDYNGGLGDTLHAAKWLHRIVDEVALKHDPAYTRDKLARYERDGSTRG